MPIRAILRLVTTSHCFAAAPERSFIANFPADAVDTSGLLILRIDCNYTLAPRFAASGSH
jgi:hypothetical protein